MLTYLHSGKKHVRALGMQHRIAISDRLFCALQLPAPRNLKPKFPHRPQGQENIASQLYVASGSFQKLLLDNSML